MAKTERELRDHQVKISLCSQDAIDVSSCARGEGIGSGTFIRRLVLRHFAAQNKARVVTAATGQFRRDSDPVKLGSHVSAWFTDDEYALLRKLVAETELTVSGYVGRRVIEPWLFDRRNRSVGL